MDGAIKTRSTIGRNTAIETEKPVIVVLFISFIILNALKLSLFNYQMMPDRSPGALAYKFIFTVLVNLVLYTFFFKLRNKYLILILYVVEAVYVFSYMSYFSYFGNYLHLFQMTALFTEGVGSVNHFTIPVHAGMLIIFLDLIPIVALMRRYGCLKELQGSLRTFSRTVRYISLLALILLEVWNAGQGLSVFQLGKNFFKEEGRIIVRYGTLVNNICDLTVNYGGENMLKHFQYGKETRIFAEAPKHPNIVAIQVESMDAGIVSREYNGRYVMPFLHSLSQNNIYFPYVLSYHKAGGTSDAEFSILNSIEPLSSYPSMKIPKYTYPNSFVRQLAKAGYYTAAYHGNIGNYYNRDIAFAKMDFKDFFDLRRMNYKETGEGWGVPDEDLFNYALDKLKEQKSPFFAYLITLSSHMPFKNTNGYYHNTGYDTIQDETVRNYYHSMSYVDQSLEEFIGKIQSAWPDTCILIWGDHTPGITSEIYKQTSYTGENKYFEFVPLVMVTPDGKKYTESKNAGSFLDIAPTILGTAGIEYSLRTDGVDLAKLPSTLPGIPFKEKVYDRRELFAKITESMAGMK